MARLIPLRSKLLAALAMALVFLLVLSATSFAAPSESPPSSPHVYHCVRWGETLTWIGWRYGVSPWVIARYNGIPNPNLIYAGQCLVIPYRPIAQPRFCWWCGGWWYIVRPGDTLWSIGWRYGYNPYHLARINGIRNPNLIFVGQRLWIP